jgi:hypothetical protein
VQKAQEPLLTQAQSYCNFELFVDVSNQMGIIGMSELMREQRLQIMLTDDELRAIDDWRFTKRMPTRAAAVRELLKRGLSAEGFGTASAGEKSQDFSVISKADGEAT